MTANNNDPYAVNLLQGVAYALPLVPVGILMTSNVVLSGIYATHHGLALSAISLVMLIVGLFDVIGVHTIKHKLVSDIF